MSPCEYNEITKTYGTQTLPTSKEYYDICEKEYSKENPEDINGLYLMELYGNLKEKYTTVLSIFYDEDEALVEKLKIKYKKYINTEELKTKETWGSLIYLSVLEDLSGTYKFNKTKSFKFIFDNINADLFDIDMVYLFSAIKDKKIDLVEYFNNYVENNNKYTGKNGKFTNDISSKILDNLKELDKPLQKRLAKNFTVIDKTLNKKIDYDYDYGF